MDLNCVDQATMQDSRSLVWKRETTPVPIAPVPSEAMGIGQVGLHIDSGRWLKYSASPFELPEAQLRRRDRLPEDWHRADESWMDGNDMA